MRENSRSLLAALSTIALILSVLPAGSIALLDAGGPAQGPAARADLSKVQPVNQELVGDLLTNFDDPALSSQAKALASAQSTIQHRQSLAQNGELDARILPMLDRQQANLELSGQILAIGEEEHRSPQPRALEVADLGVADRQQMAEDGVYLDEAIVPSLEQARGNIQTAGSLLDTIDEPRGHGLAKAIDLAQLATRHQASSTGLDWDPAPAYRVDAAPSELARELVQRHDLTPTPAQEQEIDRLDEAPEPTRSALANLLDTFLAFDDAVDSAYADADLDALRESEASQHPASLPTIGDDLATLHEEPRSEGEPGQPPAPLADEFDANPAGDPLAQLEQAGVDLSPILPARNRLLDAALELDLALEETEPSAQASDRDPIDVEIAPALAIDTGTGDDVYAEDIALLVDAGGNDRYPNNAGGSNLVGEATGDCRQDAPTGAGALFDLGVGDDDYTSPDRGCGVRGGGYLGAGLLVDEGGNDTFASYTVNADGPASLEATGSAGAPTDSSAELDAGREDGAHEAEEAPADRYIVGLDGGLDHREGDGFHGEPIVETSHALRFLVVEPEDPNAFVTNAEDDPDVRYVEEDQRVELDYVPNDPRLQAQYGPQQINAPDAWDTSLGDTTRNVCIVDSGVDLSHPDLPASRYAGGYDFVNDDADPYDDNGHGTHVTGIAAATVDNAEGIAGVGNIGFQAVKTYADNGVGYASDVAQGIQWCADNDGDVISMSFSHAEFTAVGDAIENASAAGSLLVTSAGNDGCFDCITYPGVYDDVIAVTCSDRQAELCSFSSYGLAAELAAPGDAVLSTANWNDTGYARLSGTSMSTPFVSGAAALVWSQAPEMKAHELRQLLRDNAPDLGTPGCDEKYGHGIVDAAATVQAALDGEPPAFAGATECMSGGYFGTNGGANMGVGLLVAAGEGTDTFHAGGYGTNGGGLKGLGAIITTGPGNDTYTAGEGATNGGAISGAGFLVDTEGNDAYRADSRGANGGSWGYFEAGMGFLLDADGENAYQATNFGTNGGAYARGVGFLYDAGTGDSSYKATLGGTNGAGAFYAGVGMLLDEGGDDAYEAGAASNGGSYVHSAGFLVDIDGNDAYTATEKGTNGGSLSLNGAAGFLADTGGDDSYTATDSGTNGGGLGSSVGFLLDTAGTNEYSATLGATNGGGASTVLYYGAAGFLFDAGEGDSTYTATDRGTNGGAFNYASGLLLDAGGANAYEATNWGTNGGAAGQDANAALIDLGEATTRYNATYGGTNGGGYGWAVGLLADAAGDDTYEATDRATNGGGQVYGAGLLVDRNGNDVYEATDRAANGGGFGGGTGTLVDWDGHDIYQAGSHATNGGGFSEGDGMLLDRRGDDTYQAGECGTNGGADGSCLPTLLGADPLTHGLLLDGGGTDSYDDDVVACEDCTHAPKGGAGAQIDGDAGLLWEAIDG